MTAAQRALSGGLPTGDLPVVLTVSPFANPGRRSAIAVTVGLSHSAELASISEVELTVMAFTTGWKQVAAFTQRFMLPAPAARGPLSETFVRLDLPPGRHEIRAVLRDPADDRTGSAFASVIVPDFNRQPLSLSGLVLSREPAGTGIPANLAGIVPARPTTARAFDPRDRAAVTARVSQGRSGALLPVRITARIIDAQDRVVFSSEATLEPVAFSAGRQADYRLDLPLDRLGTGEHLLTIAAGSGARAEQRDLRFTVR